MRKSEQINELGAALAKAQGEMSNAKKDAANPFFKSHYATLGSVWDAIRGPLSKHGLSIVQTTEFEGERVTISTTLLHASGQWIEGTIPVLSQKQDSQSMGSAMSYARRYALMGMIGIAAEDDDGEATMGRSAPQQKPMTAAPAAARVSITQPAPAGENTPQQGALGPILNKMRTPGAMPTRS